MSNRAPKGLKYSAFTLKNVARNFLLITFLFAINKLGAPGNAICMSCLAFMAVRSVEGALKAMVILGIVIMGNPYIVEKTVVLTLFRFPLLGLAGGRILYEMLNYRTDLLQQAHLNALLFFGGVCVMLAPLNGYFVSVSILKSIIFTFGAYAVLVGTEMNRTKQSDLTVFFTAVLSFVVVGSCMTFPLGISHILGMEQGVVRAGAGLAGITSQQQALGAFLAVSGIFSFSMAAFSKVPHRWIFVLNVVAIAPLISMTLSRTAAGTMLGSVLMVICIAPFVVRGQRANFNRFKPLPWIVSGIIGAVCLVFFDLFTGGRISEAVNDFALKGMSGRYHTVEVEDFAISRMGLIVQSWDLFVEHPLTGINFGTSTARYFVQHATLLSAPTEKGFMPTAVLEEVGIIGAGFFLIFLGFMFRKLYNDENILGIAVFGGFLIQNLGEMMFFSFGGSGLFCWSMVGAAIGIGYKHQFNRRV
jgi:hypothetical protein